MAAANPANPQTWNRYAYVSNSPLNGTDPAGLSQEDDVSDPNRMLYVDPTYGPGNCSAQYSFQDCGGWTGVWSGVFGDGLARYKQEYGGLSADMVQGLQRYKSINATGWDPVLGVNWAILDALAQQRYSDSMQKTLAALLQVDPSELTPLGVVGGNANFAIDQATWEAKSAGCTTGPFGAGSRCGFLDSLHFESGIIDGTLAFWVHMDTFNPNAGFGLGLLGHLFVDGFLGHTFLADGIPH